jgi:hypothetical protein
MTKQTIKRWNERLQSEVWTKSDIMSMNKVLNDLEWPNNQPEFIKWREAIQTIFYKYCNATKQITPEQTEFGLKWLKSYCFKLNGQPRAQKDNPFTEHDRRIIQNFSHFELVGFEDISNYRVSGRSWYVPIYRTWSTYGCYFDYITPHWSAPQVVGRGES